MNGDGEGGGAERQVTLANSRGLHARASAKFVRLAESFDCEISVEKDGLSVSGTSIMGLLLLAAARGDHLTLRAQGKDAEAALAALESLIGERFEERD